MSDTPLFQNADETERIYAPQQVPDEQRQVVADEGAGALPTSNEPPAAAPVANVGASSNAPAAPPNIGDEPTPGAPGDPQTEAGYPMDDRDTQRDIKR